MIEDDSDAGYHSLRPRYSAVLGGAAIVAALSALTLSWQDAIASIVLGTLMIAGADVDARTQLLPDVVTGGALACGLVVAGMSDPSAPWTGLAAASAGAVVVGSVLYIARVTYAWLRHREGIGLGDVKLAAAVGAWLPLDATPACFALASGAALIATLLARRHGEPIDRHAKVPFGAFLCLSLWIVDYTTRLPSG
jgi:leader peptidase (prepilin peptidase)/N-methyltransferase